MPARLLIVVLAAAALLATGCSSGGDSTTTATTTDVATTEAATTPSTPVVPPTTITSHVSADSTGPWSSSITLKLPTEFGIPKGFYVCAVWKHSGGNPCSATPGLKLPPGTILRLEQQPIGPAVTNPDSSGWGTVGTSEVPALSVVLSNFVAGNKPGTFTYRTTLRSADGSILARSRPVTVTWHK